MDPHANQSMKAGFEGSRHKRQAFAQWRLEQRNRLPSDQQSWSDQLVPYHFGADIGKETVGSEQVIYFHCFCIEKWSNYQIFWDLRDLERETMVSNTVRFKNFRVENFRDLLKTFEVFVNNLIHL